MSGNRIPFSLISKIAELLPRSQDKVGLQNAELEPDSHLIANEMIDRIPQLMADAIAKGEDFATVCPIFVQGTEQEWQKVPQSFGVGLFKVQHLQFALPTPESRALASVPGQKPEPSYLRRAAYLIWQYCQKNDLRPSLNPYEYFEMWDHGPCVKRVAHSWIIIRWQKEQIDKMLRRNVVVPTPVDIGGGPMIGKSAGRRSCFSAAEMDGYRLILRRLVANVTDTALLLGKTDFKSSEDSGLRSSDIMLNMQLEFLVTPLMAAGEHPDKHYALRLINQTIENINKVRERIGAPHILYYSGLSRASVESRTDENEGRRKS